MTPQKRTALVKATIKAAKRGEAYRNWYSDARDMIDYWAAQYGFGHASKELIAAVISATSPRVSVKRNLSLSRKVLDDYAACGLLANAMMGNHGIMESTHKVTAQVLRAHKAGGCPISAIRGLKTLAFASALAGNDRAVVLDVWMSRHFRCDQAEFKKPKAYAEYADVVTRAAAALGWTPCQVQAAVWADAIVQYGRVSIPTF